MKSALVTGSRGFVGRHICRRLYDDGWDVNGLDTKAINLDLPGPDFYDTQQDATSYMRSAHGVKCGYDLVVHCAAVVGGRQHFTSHPLSVAAANLKLDAELFRWVATQGTPGRTTIIYYSSSAVYPVSLQTDLGREYRLREFDQHVVPDENGVPSVGIGVPDAVYGWVKLTGEMLAEYARQQGVKVHVLRPFSGYGADQDLAYPFPAFIDRAKRQASPFEIWGSGFQSRDWIHIDDIVNATMAIYDAQDYRTFNLCTGQQTTMYDLADLCMAKAGYNGWHKVIDDAPLGVQHRVGDPTRLHEVYTPQITIEEGVERALKGY